MMANAARIARGASTPTRGARGRFAALRFRAERGSRRRIRDARRGAKARPRRSRRPSAPTSAFIRRGRCPPAGSGRSCCSSIPGTPSRLGRACAMPWPSGGQGPMPRRPLRVVARFKPRCGHGRRRARAAPAIGAVVCEHVREVALRARAGGVEPGCIDGGQRRRRSLAPWWSVPRRSNLGGRRVCEDLCAEEEEERPLHAGAEVDVSGE